MKNKKITGMDLEMGQMVFGNPVGEFTCPEYIEALIAYIFEEIDRVYWNKNQKKWNKDENPKVKGIEFRPYYWGERNKEAIKPNFKYKEVEVRWYKHFGRSVTLNVSKTEKEWIKWFEDCLAN